MTAEAGPEALNGKGKNAVVIGGSISGSLAARVLADHFERVIVVDRDPLMPGVVTRPGAPHSEHFHTLLGLGRNIMDELYPSFTEDALAQGAELVSITNDVLTMRRYGYAPRFPSDVMLLLCSRTLIEDLVRGYTRTLPNVEYLTNTTATGLVLDAAGINVCGVQVEGTDGSEPRQLDSQLVVNASGRKSKHTEWLTELGFESPETSSVNAHWGYSSCFVEVPEGFDPGFRVFSAQPKGSGAEGPARTRGVSFWAQDGTNRWILTAVGCANDHPGGTIESIREFIKPLGYEPVEAALDSVVSFGPIALWRNTANRLSHFDADLRHPGGIVAIGDAIAAFNPVYGQGMTVAAVGARSLAAQIEASGSDFGPDFASGFYARLFETVNFCWALSTGADYRVEGVTGPAQPETAKTLLAYADRLEALTSEDHELYKKYWETAQMLRDRSWMYADDVKSRIESDWDRLGALVGAK